MLQCLPLHSHDAAPKPEKAMPANHPERIGPYVIIGELGRGGMAVVFEAEDPRLKRRIALKVLPDEHAGDSAWLARFEREAQTLAAINHPNIATVHSLEEDGGLRFITMELVEGDLLADLIAWEPMSVGETLRLGRQIARGLEAAHKQGVVHRDLKSQNIKVTADGYVKILDFGLAKPVAQARQVTSTNAIVGTPGYMSPEQLRGEAVDHRSDLWSFGCVLYECLTGQLAFPGDSVSDLIVSTLKREPEWEALPEETPGRLRELLAQCLTKDVDRRLGMARLARQEIEEQIAQGMLPARPTSQVTATAAHPTNLPRQLSSFVGRERPLADVKQLLGANHLVTLTGFGGCGKSRLAIEVARELLHNTPDGVWLVELAPLTEPALVPTTVAAALGVQEEPNRPPVEGLVDYLQGKNLLLVIDNCEHLLPACAQLIHSLLEARSELRVLATSREALGMTGETIYQLPPLGLPAEEGGALSTAAIEETEAVRLFVERGAAVNPGFSLTQDNAAAVVEICRRLEGIPLALELAAARVKVMGVDEIAARLDDRFRLLTAGSKTALPHHQTLRALVDWSYDHLTPTEQSLIQCLSVHAGGWTLDAAERVCAGNGVEEWEVLDLLSNLVDKSLVELDVGGVDRTGRARYRMLETVRQYAAQRLLESGKEPPARARHRDYYVELAEEVEPRLTGPEQGTWLSRLEAEHGNLRVALDTCARASADVGPGLRLAGALGRYWLIRGHWSEGRDALARLLARTETDHSTPPRANALKWAGNLAYMQGDYAPAHAFYEESLTVFRNLGDRAGVGAVLSNLGNTAVWQAEYAQACAYYEESLAIRRQLGDQWGIAASLNNLGNWAYLQGDYTRARACYEESLAISRELGDRTGDMLRLINLGNVTRMQGEYAEAHAVLVESLALARELANPFGTAMSLEAMGKLAVAREEYPRAARLLGSAEAHREEISAPLSPAEREELEREVSSVQRSLGEEAFAAAWAEGRGLSIEQAVALATASES
jgi:non-specific serine/threonine protein kinase